MKRVILISGLAEHGKSLTAKYLKLALEAEGFRVIKIGFADYLKFSSQAYFDWNGKKDEEGRSFLQIRAEESRKINPDVFARIVSEFLMSVQNIFDFAIIDDWRYKNEYFVMQENFHLKTVRVRRYYTDGRPYENSLTPEQRNHISETNLINQGFNFFIDNDGTEDGLLTAMLPLIKNLTEEWK